METKIDIINSKLVFITESRSSVPGYSLPVLGPRFPVPGPGSSVSDLVFSVSRLKSLIC